MKKLELRQIIKEEISKALKENKLNPELDEAFLGLLPDIKKGESLEITGTNGVVVLTKVKKGEYEHRGDKLRGHEFKSGEKFTYVPGEKITVGDIKGVYGKIEQLRKTNSGEKYKKVKL